MKRLLFLLLSLAGLYVATELGTKQYAQSRIEQEIEDELRTSDASASVSLPVVYPVLRESDVHEVRISVRAVDVGPFVADEVTAEFNGVRIDRDETFRDRALRVQSIDELVATAEITDGEVTKVLPSGFSFQFQEGAVVLNAPGGISLRGRFELSRGDFRFDAQDDLPGGVAAPSFRLTDVPYLSCFNKIELRPGRAVISCVITNPPPPPELTGEPVGGR